MSNLYEAIFVPDTVIQNDDKAVDIYLKKNHSAWDLSGISASGCTLDMKEKGATGYEIEGGVCSIQTAANGYITYSPTAGEFDDVGDYEAQIHVEDGSGKRRSTERAPIRVEEEL